MEKPILVLQSSPLSAILSQQGSLPKNVAAYLPGSERIELSKFRETDIIALRNSEPYQVVCADVDNLHDPWLHFEQFLAAHGFSIPEWDEVMESDSFEFAIIGRRYRPAIAAAALRESGLCDDVQILLNTYEMSID